MVERLQLEQGHGETRKNRAQCMVLTRGPHRKRVEGMGDICLHSSVKLQLENQIYSFVITAEWRGARFWYTPTHQLCSSLSDLGIPCLCLHRWANSCTERDVGH